MKRKLRFGIQLIPSSFSDIIRQSILCEQNSFDSIWFPDHFIGGHPSIIWSELYTTMVIIGINTSKVIIGSAVTDAIRRHPVTIAQSIATIDCITGGRVALGIGAGEAMNLSRFGISMKNLYGKLRESIQLIKMLWIADYTKPANFDGKFYNFKDVYLQIKPVQKPHPPIYIGSFGLKMLRMTGELADGWIPFSHTPRTYKQSLYGPIKHGAEKVGRSFSEVEPAFLSATAISNSRDEARRIIEKPAKQLLVMLPNILKIIAPQIKSPHNLTGWSGQKKNRELISRLANDIPSDTALQTVIWGTPDDCIGQIEKFAKAGCSHFIFGFRGDWNKMIKLFGRKVIPYFKDEQDRK